MHDFQLQGIWIRAVTTLSAGSVANTGSGSMIDYFGEQGALKHDYLCEQGIEPFSKKAIHHFTP